MPDREFGNDAGTNNLLRWNAVCLFRHRAIELRVASMLALPVTAAP